MVEEIEIFVGVTKVKRQRLIRAPTKTVLTITTTLHHTIKTKHNAPAAKINATKPPKHTNIKITKHNPTTTSHPVTKTIENKTLGIIIKDNL